MLDQRPRRALRPPLLARVARVAAPVALAGIVTAGVALAASPGQTQVAYPAPATSLASSPATSASPMADREERLSRAVTGTRPSLSAKPSATPTAKPPVKAAGSPKAAPKVKRVKAKAKVKTVEAAPKAKKPTVPAPPAPPLRVVDTKYAEINLNIRTAASARSDVVAVVKTGGKLSATAAVRNGFRYVSYDGVGRWVKNEYLAESKPKPKVKAAPARAATASATGGISGASCSTGSSMESGLSSDAIAVHRALCARYSQFTSYGGLRGGGGNHGAGLAVDAMISNSTVGWRAARWLRVNARKLGVSELIYEQQIWTVQRSSEGWRPMSDRGSVSANHYDHIHISVYGNRASR